MLSDPSAEDLIWQQQQIHTHRVVSFMPHLTYYTRSIQRQKGKVRYLIQRCLQIRDQKHFTISKWQLIGMSQWAKVLWHCCVGGVGLAWYDTRWQLASNNIQPETFFIYIGEQMAGSLSACVNTRQRSSSFDNIRQWLTTPVSCGGNDSRRQVVIQQNGCQTPRRRDGDLGLIYYWIGNHVNFLTCLGHLPFHAMLALPDGLVITLQKHPQQTTEHIY